MRIVLVSEAFSKQTGYLENCLPRYLAKHGADVHVVASDLPPYHQIADYNKIYSEFTGSELLAPGTVESYDGFTLHILGHRKQFGYPRLVGLKEKLVSLRPDVVQVMSAVGWIPLDAAHAKRRGGYVLFTANHTTASVFPLARRKAPPWDPELVRCRLLRTLPGMYIGRYISRCYGATDDCADVAVRFMGVPKSKIDMCPLGVDTDLFTPVRTPEQQTRRVELRAEWGVSDEDIVCIYTGRFTDGKNPALLAAAVEELRAEGEPYRAVFYGHGPQRDQIAAYPSAVVRPFVHYRELPDRFRAADIGVWPTQESTSMLDAAACGLPVVVNHTLIARERIEGNGITYQLNDLQDLKRALRELRTSDARAVLGSCGAERIPRLFSWDGIARRRLRDYEAAISADRSSR